jgi:hypothetical protein
MKLDRDTEYARDWLGDVCRPRPTWLERAFAPLAKGSIVAALMMATGLFAFAIGYGLR